VGVVVLQMWYDGTKEDARTACKRGGSGEDPEEASEEEGLEKDGTGTGMHPVRWPEGLISGIRLDWKIEYPLFQNSTL